jgi:hypothetical protein
LAILCILIINFVLKFFLSTYKIDLSPSLNRKLVMTNVDTIRTLLLTPSFWMTSAAGVAGIAFGAALYIKYGVGEVAGSVKLAAADTFLTVLSSTVGGITGAVAGALPGFLLGTALMNNLCDCHLPAGIGSNKNTELPDDLSIFPIIGTSIGAVVLGAVLVKRYNITIRFPALTIGLVASSLLTFNFAVILGRVFCHCPSPSFSIINFLWPLST